MRKIYKDDEYMIYVKDILDNTEFKKLKKYLHHGITRYDHCVRVSYNSYKIAKKLKLNSKDVARAGLLHDFFLVNNQKIDKLERFKVLFSHPRIAVENSKKYFTINEKEENIILSHMFPFGIVLPKYKESILVDIIDDAASIYERMYWICMGISSFIKRFRIKKIRTLFSK